MSNRVTLEITLELRSDAIFSSGFSIPGGEDIAVCQDGEGYPYLKGSTFKGLLLESVKNLLAWTGQSGAVAAELFGESGWEGVADGRRIQLTALYLAPRPDVPENCFITRVFTSLDKGVAEAGSLRAASCIRRGMCFKGTVTCDREDVTLIRQALQGVKWAGTLRSRGFGRVKCTLGAPLEAQTPAVLKDTHCIRYRLLTQMPVLITDLSRSRDNSYATRGYLPGSAIRGMVASTLAQRDPEWFSAHRTALLGDGTRFLDALPCDRGESPKLPGIMGFYGKKGSNEVVSVLNADVAGMKRAGLGTCCTLEGETVRGWHASTGGDLRIRRQVEKNEDSRPFQTRHIDAGQTFEGYILLDNPALAGVIGGAFEKYVWLGADRYEGFGQCEVTALEGTEAPAWQTCGYAAGETADTTLYLLALSPLTMLDCWGEPCGLDTDMLAKRLGVGTVEIETCSTAMTEFSGYNRTWKCRIPTVRMYDRGSVFKLRCSEIPKAEALLELQRTGLGIRRAEGFGQVLFVRRELLERIHRRAEIAEVSAVSVETPAAKLRRAKYRWVMEHSGELYREGLSKSQLGTIQALCEKAISRGSTAELMAHMAQNIGERGARHASRYRMIDSLVRQVLDTPLAQTLGEAGPDSTAERLKLLCLLFDHSRKEEQA